MSVWDLLRAHLKLILCSLLLISVNRAAGLVWPYLSKYLVDDAILRRSQSTLVVLVMIGGIGSVLQGISAYLIARSVNLYVHRLVADLRKRVHYHVSRLPLAFYDANKTGALVSRVITDIEGVRNILGGGFASFLGTLITALIAFTVLIRIDAVMTLLIFLTLVPSGVIARRLLIKYRPHFIETNTLRAEMTGRLTESFSGVRVVKAFGAESHEHEVFRQGIDRLLEKITIITKASASLDLILVIVIGVTGAIVTYLGGISAIGGTKTLGDLFRYIMFLGVLVSPLVQLVSIGTQFNDAYAALERVRELLAEPREGHDTTRRVRIGQLKGDVCFESVSFGYNSNSPVLHEISFRARSGTVTALVGPSGAGKTTITGLIAGFYKPGNGVIKVDGFDLASVSLDSYRAHLGMVTQDPFLFSGTIRENVVMGRPGATDEDVARACRLAHVDEFAGRLGKVYETIVGERGIKLSMGQRQRVAIARAILANPRILILDEATSSLDSVSEAVIQEALSFLLQDRTTFVIAHRLSTIHQADQILVIDHGRIAESGTHQSLLRARDRYWRLYNTQLELQSNLFISPEGAANGQG